MIWRINFTSKLLKKPLISALPMTKINHPILWKLNKKITLATQLRTDTSASATKMQVTNYGLGGLCEPHIDPVGIMEVKKLSPGSLRLPFTGDIIGTFMAWLSDTEAGGGTVYSSPGFEGIVMPERGAAGFWYDLLSDGKRDLASFHGGCPVLKGSKWILNKWLHAYDNFKKFPCSVKRGARFLPPNPKHYF